MGRSRRVVGESSERRPLPGPSPIVECRGQPRPAYAGVPTRLGQCNSNAVTQAANGAGDRRAPVWPWRSAHRLHEPARSGRGDAHPVQCDYVGATARRRRVRGDPRRPGADSHDQRTRHLMTLDLARGECGTGPPTPSRTQAPRRAPANSVAPALLHWPPRPRRRRTPASGPAAATQSAKRRCSTCLTGGRGRSDPSSSATMRSGFASSSRESTPVFTKSNMCSSMQAWATRPSGPRSVRYAAIMTSFNDPSREGEEQSMVSHGLRVMPHRWESG